MKFAIYITTLILLSLSSSSCKKRHLVEFVEESRDSSIKSIKVNMTDLAKNYKYFHGKHIETTGIFHSGFEEFAIYKAKGPFENTLKGFSLEPDESLISNWDILNNIQGSLVTVKGIVDTTQLGHLSSYLATIKNIYYFKQL